MPSFITHALVGNDIRQRLSRPEAVNAVKQYPIAFEWGCQGPDLLFFRNGWKKKDNPLGEHGPRLHKEDTDRLFREICRYLTSLKDIDYFVPSLSYALGFLCHYVLDKNIHPYVYFMQEKMRSRYHSSVPYGIHMKLETDLDTAFYRYKTGHGIRHYKLNPMLIKSPECQAVACHFLARMILANHDARFNPDEIQYCLTNLYRKERFMLEPSGFVSFAACKCIDKARGETNVQGANCRPERVGYDILNQKHSLWKNFRQKDIPRRESVPELLDMAAEEACHLSELLLDAIENQEDFPLTGMPTFDDGNPELWGQ